MSTSDILTSGLAKCPALKGKDNYTEWEEIGTWLQLSIAYAHNQNGVVERAIRTIVEHAVSILSDSKMPDYIWYEICLIITYLGNLLPHSHLHNDATTPI